MNVETVLLSEGCVALLAVVGLLAGVYSLVDLQVVGDVKGLLALSAVVRTLPRVDFHVRPVGFPIVESLRAQFALELFLFQMDAIHVLVENILFKEGSSALSADVGPGTRQGGVHSRTVKSQVSGCGGAVRAEVTE